MYKRTSHPSNIRTWTPIGLLSIHLNRSSFFFFFLEHRRRLIIWLIFRQVERRFHGLESNRQPLRPVWVPLHYHPVI